MSPAPEPGPVTQPDADSPVPFDPVTAALRQLRDRLLPDERGEVATYIPELATADPTRFGIALVSTDGARYAAGDAGLAFTIQSISKPFTYALALTDLGLDAVSERVGSEPSGEAFNAISLDPDTGRPANPMINAGAIVAASLVRAGSTEERFERIRRCLSAFAGRELMVDERVRRSELDTGDRNRALAYLMRNAGSLTGDVDEHLDVYVSLCSLLVDARDVAVMAATLANGGTNPVTGEVVVAEAVAEQTMSVMATCGMYDFAGEWLLRVGLPAKSGVSGGLVAVSPGQFGIGLYSPPLDDRGNSVRAVEACRSLSADFSLHLLHRPAQHAAGLVEVTGLAGSTDRGEGDPTGGVVVLRLRGEVEFATAERALQALEPLRHLGATEDGERRLVLDLTAVTRCHPVATAMLTALGADLAATGTAGTAGTAVVIVDPARRGLFPTIAEVGSFAEAGLPA